YFDPTRERRVDGLAAMKAFLVPLTGKISVDHYEMLNPRVQLYGDAAILTYNLVSYPKSTDRPAPIRWNSTAVYANRSGKWKIVHSHWSFTGAGKASPTG